MQCPGDLPEAPPLGGIFPAHFLQISLNHETLRELGGSLALGTIQVLDEKDCIISLVRRQIDFLLDQPGAQCPSCHQSLIRIRDLLAEIAGGEATADKVVIIGGGNAAMDAARTCVRLSCREVHVSYRRTRREMPAHPEEVEQSLEEGVKIHFLTVPIKVGGEPGQVQYLECLQAELGRPDASGRRRPISLPDSNFRLEVGAVITAIGQQPDLCPFPTPPVNTGPWCTIITDRGNTRTNVTDIFAGGDSVTGPATAVEAIAAGKQGAREKRAQEFVKL